MTSAMAIATAASSLLHSKPPPPPPTLLSHSPQSAQQLHLPKTTSSKWTPLVLTTSHSTLEKTMPTTSRSTNFPDLSFLSSLTTSAIDNLAMECRRRRFFESTQDKKKRKTRDAARRNSQRRPQPRTPVKQEAPKKKKDDDDDDNWELP
eukprot:XP_024437588.1 uncharacterized protein LOC7458083 isoform X2 [Populus trichocarpa]